MKYLQKLAHFLKEQWFRIGIIIVLIFIAFLLYEALIVRPEKEAELHAAELRGKAEQDKEAEDDRQSNIDSCLQDAYSTYNQNWNQSCKTDGRLSSTCEALLFNDDAYTSYLKSHPELKDKSFSEQLNSFTQVKDDCSCTLPTATSDRWDSTYKEDQQACYSRYK